MATTASPLPVRQSSTSSSCSPSPSFFQLPNKKRRQNRPIEHDDDVSEQTAVLQEEASLRTQALVYLDDFLHNSKWTDQLDQIAIVQEAVPTMPELNSYGDMDEKEGTRVCRRLFKAVVVWDELGHNLWRTLRAASEQRKLVQRQFEGSLKATSGDMFHPAAFTSRRRPSRRSSEDSYDSAFSQLSLESTRESTLSSADGKRRLRMSKKLSISSTSSSQRSSSELESAALECQASSDSSRHSHQDSVADQSHMLDATSRVDAPLPPPPKIHWPAAMKRTLGVFGDGRTGPATATSMRQRSHSSHSSHPRPEATRSAVVASNFF
ncbi:hypothetical protein XA68_11843 [Ophiocordyceps unilateralis]|uniref:Uncharacterized protein n=1 Tax=Ophiocordyceps unilateralis TaxID=268505 RepID=A0A2A9PE94_OPHUN|nr:hypothetical protein XA68_11843 [Ophiocordyceps unilateralis]